MKSFLPVLAQRLLDENSVLFIVGPTGVGKSAMAVDAAECSGGEIISCDALQVYREVNIASDKPSKSLRERAAHHLIDVVSVTEDFNAAKFCTLAVAAIEEITRRGRKPIFCGGSGMYMMALLDGLFDSVEIPDGIRESLLAKVVIGGLPELYQRLQSVDPVAAGRIDSHDQQRIVRALEVFEATGTPISLLQRQRNGLWGKMPIGIVGLTRRREELYARAEARIEMMFSSGLVEEIRDLSRYELSVNVSRLIGVREVQGYINGEYDLNRAKELMKLNTRHYIKRQLTWFRRDQRVKWVELS